MNYLLKPVFTLMMITFLTSTSAQAGSEEKMIIALKTDNDTLVETDISELAIGEAKTIETSSGKVIDILRTTEGAELYVDGELLEMDFDDETSHIAHKIRHKVKKHVEIICDEGEECDETEIVFSDEDVLFDWVSDDDVNIIINEDIEFSCKDDEDGTSCSDKVVWVSRGDDIDLEEIHEIHQGDEDHKVMLIRKEVVTEK
jgi:hypothetical protein